MPHGTGSGRSAAATGSVKFQELSQDSQLRKARDSCGVMLPVLMMPVNLAVILAVNIVWVAIYQYNDLTVEYIPVCTSIYSYRYTPVTMVHYNAQLILR